MPWLPGTYDPDLNLYYFGTGNPQPVLTGSSREGDNLYTCSIVAINPDTLSSLDLYRYVRFVENNGQNAERWRHALWVKFAYPLAAAVMVYLAIPLVLGAIETALAPFATPAGIAPPGAVWIVTAAASQA